MTTKSDAPTILIADDSVPMAITLKEGLKWFLNCHVLTAFSGREALQHFDQQVIDLLITDYRMPDMDGLALARQIRQQSSEVAIIMISGYPSTKLRQQAAELSIQHVLTKPVGLSHLQEAVLEILNERAAEVGVEPIPQ